MWRGRARPCRRAVPPARRAGAGGDAATGTAAHRRERRGRGRRDAAPSSTSSATARSDATRSDAHDASCCGAIAFAEVVLGARTVPRLQPRRRSRRTVALTVPAASRRAVAADRLRARAAAGRRRCACSVPPSRPHRRAAARSRRREPIVARPRSTILPARPARDRRCATAARSSPRPTAPADGFTAMFAATTGGWTGGDATFSAPLPERRDRLALRRHVPRRADRDGGRDQRTRDVRNTSSCRTTLPDHAASAGRSPRRARSSDHEGQARGSGPTQPVIHGDRSARSGRGWRARRPVRRRRRRARDLRPRLRAEDVSEDVPSLPGQWWGAAIADDATHTYVFGIHDVAPLTSVFLARTPREDLDGAWEYRTATGWSDRARATRAGAHRRRPRLDAAQRDARRGRLGAGQPGRPRRHGERVARDRRSTARGARARR